MRTTESFGPIVQPTPRPKASIIKVAADGSGDCRTIDGAMCLACPGDSILLADGKYDKMVVWRDNLDISSFDPKKQIVVTGITIANVTGTKVHDLTIVTSDNKLPENNYGVFIVSGNQTKISNCQIHGFMAGIVIDSSTDVTLEGNAITENVRGIAFFSNNSSVKIVGNLIRKNNGGGIGASGQTIIYNNTIIENRVSTDEFG